MRSISFAIIAVVMLSAQAWTAGPTFQELMDPSQFPEAQYGLRVERVEDDAGAVKVVTTGAEIAIDASQGVIEFRQRIGHARRVATWRLGRALEGMKVTHRGEGLAWIAIERPRLDIRINGDSLVMLHAHEAIAVDVESAIVPAWNASWKTNHLVVDEWGGFALYCSDLDLNDHFDALATKVASYPLPSDAVLCAGVCPPKPYDWDRSLKEQVNWHWSDKSGYPSDDDLRAWKAYGNVVLLQSEVMLWKDWNLDFVPRLGMDEFTRVRETIHGLGIKFIVYTSPYFFLKGTSQESQAVNDKPGACPGAIKDGENMPLFLDAITRVMRDLKPDGLYFDGQYMENPAGLYALARHARRIVGDGGILEWHTTTELGNWGSQMYMPQADAYTDIQLRGEGQDALYGGFDYLRFFVSGYNINNCIGVLCNNSGKPMTTPLLDTLLQANGRLHTLVGNPALCTFMDAEYRPRLTPELRVDVDRCADERQAKVASKADTIRAFLNGPDWKEAPVFAVDLDSMPEAERVVSPANDSPFSITDGALTIRAHAHTYAFLRIPLDRTATGLLVKVRQGTDGGMSWGPGAMIRWANGDGLRIATRPSEVQVDVMGTQLLGPPIDPSAWIWLRARWDDSMGVVEMSKDGIAYERFFTFFRASGKDDIVKDLLIGKIPYNGQPQDHTEPGGMGECSIDWVRLMER